MDAGKNVTDEITEKRSNRVIEPKPDACNVFTLDQWAARWGIKRSTVYNLVKRGELHVIKIGSRTFITDEEDEAYHQRAKVSSIARFEKSQELRRAAKEKADHMLEANRSQAKAKQGQRK